jgi:hypothetical protein
MINDNYLQLQTALENQLQNNTKKIKLEKNIAKLIAQIDDPLFIQELLKENNTEILSVNWRDDGKSLTIKIDWDICNLTGLNPFDRVNTKKGLATFLGSGFTPNEGRQLIFWVDSDEGVSYWKGASDKQSLKDECFEFIDYSQKKITSKEYSTSEEQLLKIMPFDIKRFLLHIRNKDQPKINTMLMRSYELPNEKVNALLNSVIFITALLEADESTFNFILSHLIHNEDKIQHEVYHFLFKKLLIKAALTSKFQIIKILLTLEISPIVRIKSKYQPSIKDFLNKIPKQIIREFFISQFFDSELIISLNENLFSDGNIQIFLSAKHFYSALEKRKNNMNCFPELTLSFDTDYETTLGLLRGIFSSLPNYLPETDISFLEDFIKVAKLICLDKRNENVEQLTELFKDALLELYGTDFDVQCQNKTLFSSNAKKIEFFKKHLKFFSSYQQEMNGNNNENAKQHYLTNKSQLDNNADNPKEEVYIKLEAKHFPEIDVTEDVIFDMNLENCMQAMEKLYKLRVADFNEETKIILLRLSTSADKAIAAKAYYKLGEIGIDYLSLNSQEDKSKLSEIELYFAKSLLLGHIQPSFQSLNQHFPHASGKYSLLKEFTTHINLLEIDFTYLLGRFNENNSDIYSLKLLEKTVLECKHHIPIAALHLGYFYSLPDFTYHNPGTAFDFLEYAIQEKCQVETLNSFIVFYNKKPFAGAEVYAQFLQSRLLVSNPKKSETSIDKTGDKLIRALTFFDSFKKSEKINENMDDLSHFFDQTLSRLETLVINLSEAAKSKALKISSQKLSSTNQDDNNDSAVTELNEVTLELDCVNVLINQLSRNKERMNSKEELTNYLKYFKNELDNYSSKKLIGIKTLIQQSIDKIEPGSFKARFISFFSK